jgi:hypothetical protein
MIGIGKDFFSRTPEAQQLRERVDKVYYITLKSFCTTKEMVSKLKRPPNEENGESILWLYIRQRTDNQNTCSKKLNCPKINEPIKKLATELNELFQRNKSKW